MMRFVPKQRVAIDNKVWWCVYDNERKCFSTFLCHGKYKTKKEAEYAIEHGKKIYGIG